MDVTTTLKIKADSKEAQKAGQTIKQAFSPAMMKDFNAATKTLNLQLVGLSRQLKTLNSLLLTGAQQATAAYKQLGAAIQGAGRSMGSFGGRNFGGGGGGAGGGAGGGGGGGAGAAAHQNRNSFVAGLAQGLGIAEYIPTEPGMGFRIGGAMVGRGMRAAAAPFLNPGMGGISQLAGAIPGIGPALAGGLATTGGAYQTAIGYQRQRMQALFQGTEAYSGFEVPRSTEEQRKFDRAQGRLNIAKATQAGLPEAQKRARAQEKAEDAATESRDMGIRTRLKKEYEDLLTETNAAPGTHMDKVNRKAIELARGKLEAFPEPTPEQKEAQRKATLPARRFHEQLRKNARHKAAADVAQAQKELKAIGGPKMEETGAEYGLSPQEVLQLQAQFMQARGGKFYNWDEEPSAGKRGIPSAVRQQVQESMVAEKFGIGPGLAGGFARGGMAGGGGQGNLTLLGGLATALQQSLDGSQLSEYMETLVDLQQQAEQRGQKIDPASFAELTIRMNTKGAEGGIGFEGLQGKRVAAGMTAAPQALADTGAQTGADMMMLRSTAALASRSEAKGGLGHQVDITTPEGYAEALEYGEKNPSAVGKATVTDYIKKMSGRGIGVGIQKLELKRFMTGKFKTTISFAQAGRWLAGEMSGKADQLTAEGMAAAKEKAETLPGQARLRVSTVAPNMGREAGLSAETIAIGNRMSKAMQEMSKTSLTMAEEITKFNGLIVELSKVVQKVIKWVGGGPEVPPT